MEKRHQIVVISLIMTLMCILFPHGFGLPLLDTIPVTAEPDLPTICTFHCNTSITWPGHVLKLTVHVLTEDLLGVETGLVTISDLNDTWSQDYILENSGGKLTIFRPITSVDFEGRHVLQAAYQGDSGEGYNPSSDATDVEFCVADPNGDEYCEVTVQPVTSIVFTNDTFSTNVNVTDIGSFDAFSGGNIAIYSPSEDIVLASCTIPYGFYIEITETLEVLIPIWFDPGMITLIANFTDTQGTFLPAFLSFDIDVVGLGHELILNVNPVLINRVDDLVTIRVDFYGDSAIGKVLTIGWTNEITNWTIISQVVANNPEIITWSVNHTFTPGPYRVWAELLNPSTGYVYASDSQSLTLYDYVNLEWEVNTTDLAPGDTVAFSFTCSQQDITTLAVPSRILIFESDVLIGNVTTDDFGMAEFIWNIPVNTSGGSHALNVTVVPLDSDAGIVQQTFWIDLVLLGRTQLQLTCPTQIQRGHTLEITYQLSVEGQDPVDEGQIYFIPPNDPMMTQDVGPDGNGQFVLDISLDHPIWVKTFTVSYGGSEAYRPVEESINILIFSEPHFSVLHINASPILPGQTLRIFGQLLDEVNEGINGQIVAFYLSESIGIGTTTTLYDGSFFYNWLIPTNATPGLNIISAEFPGNISAGYLPPINQPVVTGVLISNEIALEVPEIVTVETNVSMKIHGGFGTNVTIWWQGSWNATWHLLVANLSIPTSSVPYEILWEAPSHRGDILLRMTNTLNLTVFANTAAYVDPQYDFLPPSAPIVLLIDEEFIVNASCSELYRILVNGVPVTLWRTVNTSLPISFSLRGPHTITMEITGDYVIERTIGVAVTVYEPVNININIPSNVVENTSIIIDITVTSGLAGGGPLGGKTVSIVLTDLTRCVTIAEYSTSLDTEGSRIIETDPLPRGFYEVQVVFIADQDWYEPTSESATFTIVGASYLEFNPPECITFNDTMILQARLEDAQGPISEKQIIFRWMHVDGNWTVIGENITAIDGEARLTWKPLMDPGDNYRLKAGFLGSIDLWPESIIRPIKVVTLPPMVVATHSLLPKQNGTAIVTPGEYEVVVQIEEKSQLPYEVYLAVNDQRINMSVVNGTEYLFQGINESYWIPSNGNTLYVGTIIFDGNGVYNVTVETEDSLGTTDRMGLGYFAITPPELLNTCHFLPTDNETAILPNREYQIVVSIKENSPMNYSVFLLINDSKISMTLIEGNGYILQAPNGSSFFISSDENTLWLGMTSFKPNLVYKIEILVEDQFGVEHTWSLGVFQVASINNLDESGVLPGQGDSSDLAVNEELTILLVMGSASSGAVVLLSRPRRNSL